MNDNIPEEEKFFSKVSHDLRGAFTSILGFSDILNDPTESLTKEEMGDFVTRIGNQSHDTFELLVNFINWLKLEKYDYGLDKELVEVLEILLDVKELNNRKLNEKNVNLIIDVKKNLNIEINYEILYSIFNNILIFLLKTCDENSNIEISGNDNSQNYVALEIFTNIGNKNNSLLQNIDLRDLKNEISFPIIFAIKFTELSKGKFNFSLNQDGVFNISLMFPKEINN